MNPFLDPSFFPRWSALTPEFVEPAVTEAIATARENLKAIRSIQAEEATYENTFLALEEATELLDRAWGRLQHLDSVNDHPSQREALNAMLPVVSAFTSSIPLDATLWTVLKNYSGSPAARKLDPVRSRHIEETCHLFTSSGADLPPEKKKRFAEIQAELAAITQKYSQNVLDSTNAWELILTDKARLGGLPESATEAARLDALAKGHGTEEQPAYRFTLQFPSMEPVLKHAEDESLRRELWEASCSIGHSKGFENEPLVKDILRLRQENAALLGHADFPTLALRRRMAKDPATVSAFTANLHARIKTTFQKETETLRNYKAEKTGTPPAPLHPWETSYWAEKQRRELHGLDSEALRPYFPVQHVMDGLFRIASALFGIRISPRESVFREPGADTPPGLPETWHPEVRIYDLKDAENGELLGSFYADWHPRKEKRGGAWMNSLETGLPASASPTGLRLPHLGIVCGNMTKPLGGKPALLTHGEVETIFHEFGHLIHHLLSEVPIKALSGINVAWDFVELPSQIMENFCWDRQSLDLFARHHETGAPIPEDLFRKMNAARNHLSATVFMRQLAFGRLDLELHLQPGKYTAMGTDDAEREILEGYRAELSADPPGMARHFTHLFASPTGYASGYYSYKWAEVLDADAFTRFRKEGVLNPGTGRSFRREILARGNSAPPEDLYKNFMGRPPSADPLLARSGLARQDSSTHPGTSKEDG